MAALAGMAALTKVKGSALPVAMSPAGLEEWNVDARFGRDAVPFRFRYAWRFQFPREFDHDRTHPPIDRTLSPVDIPIG